MTVDMTRATTWEPINDSIDILIRLNLIYNARVVDANHAMQSALPAKDDLGAALTDALFRLGHGSRIWGAARRTASPPDSSTTRPASGECS